MPLYEYECRSCGHRFEKIQKFSDPLLKTCPKCGGKVRKLLSAPAFQFKGSGWYVTDYARKGSGDRGGKPDKASGEKEKPSADGGEKASKEGKEGSSAEGKGAGSPKKKGRTS